MYKIIKLQLSPEALPSGVSGSLPSRLRGPGPHYKICAFCGRKFHKRIRGENCQNCVIEFQCTQCGEWNTKEKKFGKLWLRIVSGSPVFCSQTCMVKYNCASIDCKVHGPQEYSFGRKCVKCHNISVHHSINCDTHGPQSGSFHGSCLVCRNQTLEARQLSKLVGLRTGSANIKKAHLFGSGMKFCTTCDKDTYHLIGTGCLHCHNNTEVMRTFVTKRNIENWKDPEYAQRITSNLSPFTIPNWRYDNDCHLHLLEKRSIARGLQYECWGCFKDSQFHTNHDISIQNSFMQKTYRAKTGSINGQHAMEEHLIDQNISWFTYIKFYIKTDNSIEPLVVGKTGSKLVNKAGTDIRFRYDGDNPARTFLRESGFAWYTKEVLIIPSDSEENAYSAELELKKKMALFSS